MYIGQGILYASKQRKGVQGFLVDRKEGGDRREIFFVNIVIIVTRAAPSEKGREHRDELAIDLAFIRVSTFSRH